MGFALLVVIIIFGILFVFSENITMIRDIQWKKLKGFNIPSELLKKVNYESETQTETSSSALRDNEGFFKAIVSGEATNDESFFIKKIPFSFGRSSGSDYQFKNAESVSLHHMDIIYNEKGKAAIVNKSNKYESFMVTSDNIKHKNTNYYELDDNKPAIVWLTRTVSCELIPLDRYREKLASDISKPVLKVAITNSGEVKEYEWEANSKGYLIGRSDSCDLIIAAKQLEPKHLKIVYEPASKTFRMECLAKAKDSVYSVTDKSPMKPDHILETGEEFWLSSKKLTIKILETGMRL